MTTFTPPRSAQQLQDTLHTLHNETLSKQQALQLFFDATIAANSEDDLTKDLQHLWLKLHRKYKFKFKDYEKLQFPTSIHAALFNDYGHGFQTIMRFYDERNLSDWQQHLFSFGLATLLDGERFQNLALYFCNCLICEPWAESFHTEKTDAYFRDHPQAKIKELYTSYCHYIGGENTDTATTLYALLKSLNPHYKLEAKATPLLFKTLHAQKHSV